MRIAAVGDVHLGAESRGQYRAAMVELPERADILLLAGDLTRHGTLEEAEVVAAEFSGIGVPVVAVLGNHDHHSDVEQDIVNLLTDHGITVLEGTAARFDIDGHSLGVAGTKGFGGGFAGKCASVFGERLMREFAAHTVELAGSLSSALAESGADVTIALTHYSPSVTPCTVNRGRYTHSSAPTCSVRLSTRPAPISHCTAMRTPAPNGAPPRAASGCATWPNR